MPPNHTTTSGCQLSPDDAIATRTMTGAAARIPSLQSILHHLGVEDPSTCGSKVGQSGTSFILLVVETGDGDLLDTQPWWSLCPCRHGCGTLILRCQTHTALNVYKEWPQFRPSNRKLSQQSPFILASTTALLPLLQGPLLFESS